MSDPCKRLSRRTVLALSSAVAWPASWSQSTDSAFPQRPLKIIVPFTPGGTTDIMARAIGQKLTEYWRQPVVVDNRPGAAGWLGMTAVAKSPPDGYTLGITISSIIYAKSLYAKLPFNMETDFEPVSLLSRSAITLVVLSNFPANTLQEFVDLVRKQPGKHNYGSFGQGTSAHIFGETLNLHAKLDLVHAPYRGAAPIVTDLLGGQLSSAFVDTGTVIPLLQTGKVKVLAVSGTQRITALPQVPTFAEQGYKGFEPVGFFQALAPSRTPKDILNKLSEGIARALRSEEIANRIRDWGQEPGGSTPDELGEAIRRDALIFDRAIKAANIQVE